MDNQILGSITFSHPLENLSQFLEAINGPRYREALQALCVRLERRMDSNIPKTHIKLFEEVKDELIEILASKGLTLWD